MNHVVILYSELAGYLLSSLRGYADVDHPVTVFHWPVNPEAPFVIPTIPHVEFRDRQGMDSDGIRAEIERIGPSAILCSGWMDRGYLQAIKGLTTTRVLLLDNQWTGHWKQHLLGLLSPWRIRPYFDRAWVPGEPQKRFAMRLGFDGSQVDTGFYTADLDNFQPKPQADGLPLVAKRFVYVGRYVEHKGIHDMWEAFIQVTELSPDWMLHCIGTGDAWSSRVLHERVVHHGFLQPDALAQLLEDGGVFILPSHFEPWGVVVQEMAAMGMPMIISDKVGAASAFCSDENAILFPPGDIQALAQAMKSFMEMDDTQLQTLSTASIEAAQNIDQATWADTLRHIIIPSL